MPGLKISQLSSSLAPSLTGVTPVVLSGTTYKTTLQSLRDVLVDSGSHIFTGDQTIRGSLIVSGSLTAHQYIVSSSITNVVIQNVSGSSIFGNDLEDRHTFTGSILVTGSVNSTNLVAKDFLFVSGFAVIGDPIHHSGSDPEALHVGTTDSYNIAHFKGDNEYYSQVYITNYNSGSNASTDLVVVADNGTENVHFVDLGINSSTYTGGLVGRENDAYLLNVGKDLYIGTVGGTEHPAKLHLFAENNWENPQITVHTGSQVTFNTSSFTSGYTYEFSGSVKLKNELKVDGSVTASYFIGDGSQLTNLPNGLGGTTNVSMFLSSSVFNSFTSSYNDTSASFNSRISAATNEQDLSGFAITGSNTFKGNQIISGSNYLSVGSIQNLSGSLDLITEGNNVNILGSNLMIPNGGLLTSYDFSASGSATIGGLLKIKGVTEEIVFENNIVGSAEFDFNSGSIFYLSGLTSNGEYNINNVPEVNNKAITITFVIEQGSTPYSGSAYSINDTTVSIKWVDNAVPTGSANKTEIIGLTAFRVNSSWNVIGSLSTFG